MSDSVMVPRERLIEIIGGEVCVMADHGDSIDPSSVEDAADAILEAALAASTPVGGWEDIAYALVKRIGRLPHPGDDDFSYPEEDDAERDVLNGLIADAREIMASTPALPTGWTWRVGGSGPWEFSHGPDRPSFSPPSDIRNMTALYAAPPPLSVSTDNGPRPQEAVPTEQEEPAVVAALQDLLVAVTYAAPARTFAGVLAYEARVPVEFVERADAALGVSRPQPADNCSSNEEADGWIEWSGAENVAPEGSGEVRFADGSVENFGRGIRWGWRRWSENERHPRDIIAYRLVPQPADGCSSNEGAG